MADKRIVTVDYLESNYVKNTDINQTFEPTSTKAASGKAVNEAISGIQPIDENTEFIFNGGDADGGVPVDIVVDTTLSKTSNNPIANKPVAIKFGEILGAIDTLKNMVHIVESGTSGIWSYRKWSDGTAECWGKKIFSITTSSTWAGYYFGTIGSIVYPTGLFISAPILSCTVKADNFPGHTFIDVYESASETGAIGIAGHDERTVECHIHLNAKGKWK